MHAQSSAFFNAVLYLNLSDTIAEEIVRSLPLWFSKEASARIDLEQHLYEYIEWLSTNWGELLVEDSLDTYQRLVDIIKYAAQATSHINFHNHYIDEIIHANSRLIQCRLMHDEPY
jgi:hypothetical protein